MNYLANGSHHFGSNNMNNKELKKDKYTITEDDIAQEKSGLLYYKFKEWLQEVRLTNRERDEIQTIINDLRELI